MDKNWMTGAPGSRGRQAAAPSRPSGVSSLQRLIGCAPLACVVLFAGCAVNQETRQSLAGSAQAPAAAEYRAEFVAPGDPSLLQSEPEKTVAKTQRALVVIRTEYCARPKIDQLPALLQPFMFDVSINQGPGTAIKLQQQVLNDSGNACSVDGGIGDETIACAKAAAGALGQAFIDRLVERRIGFCEAIVAGDASQGVFLRGWLNRANEFLTA